MINALTCGAHHIGLAVPDLDAATRFFCDALGFSVAGERPDYPARFVSDAEGLEILHKWLDTAFEGGRHARRVEKIES
jgi:catechol 2,3-dioxygenase-like lactoylglutathione lyase family enzyme